MKIGEENIHARSHSTARDVSRAMRRLVRQRPNSYDGIGCTQTLRHDAQNIDRKMGRMADVKKKLFLTHGTSFTSVTAATVALRGASTNAISPKML